MFIQCADGIPGIPHRWTTEIKEWADGGLVQWRYAGSMDSWTNCEYASRGMPNWNNDDLEFRVAPPLDAVVSFDQAYGLE